MVTEKTSKPKEVFRCEKCAFECSKKGDWVRHLSTAKHQKSQLVTHNAVILHQNTSPHICSTCEKTYKSRNGLWTHMKKCCAPAASPPAAPTAKNDLSEVTALTTMVIELVKTNTELQKQMLDVCKNNNTVIHNSNNSNNNNKTFNLQFFLNETCKDAMNLMDFVNSVSLQLADLESVGKLGYVEGISNIMIKRLNEMDIHKRPVHCCDAKRETMYVKDENKWEKESEAHSKLRKAIKYISKKNSDMLTAWSDIYPASKNISSYLNEEYMKIIKQAMGGGGDLQENENKIIKKISKMVLIEKGDMI
jgi:hypothetical protein